MYLKKSTSLKIICKNNPENMKLKNYSNLCLFFDKFKKNVNELKQLGAIVSEQEKLNYMLRVLPTKCSHIGDLIYVLSEKDRTVDFLKSKITAKSLEKKNKCEESAPLEKSNAFEAETNKLSPQVRLC